MKRIFLFIVTNLAILVVLSITLRLLGVDRMLDAQGGIAHYGGCDRVWGFADFSRHVQVDRQTHDWRGGDRTAIRPD